jgi:hypothetical protein
MKPREREQARSLRRQGFSLNEICQRVKVSKCAASLWVRDIELTGEQIERLKNLGMLCDEGREKYRLTMRQKRETRIAAYHAQAEAEYPLLVQNPEFLFGLALYIGEGDKSSHCAVKITNCDYRVLQKSIRFFQCIGIPKERIRCDFQLHPGLPEEEARRFWRERLDLLPEQFGGVTRAVSSASQGKTIHKQPYGTCRIYTCSTVIKQKLLRWMDLALEQPRGD